jgi:hypothetical protein
MSPCPQALTGRLGPLVPLLMKPQEGNRQFQLFDFF